MGCAAQIYESTSRRKTWAENSIDGWYLRTSTEHYQSHVVHVKKTRSERITDTVWFKHKYITQPKVTPVDHIVKAINAVKPPAPSPRVEITEPANAPRIQVNKKRMSVSDANIEKVIQNASNKRTVRVPLARVLERRQQSITNSHRILREQAQLIHDKETGE